MNLEQLRAKRSEILGAAKTAHAEANAALAEGKLDVVKSLQEKVEGYNEQIALYDSQIASAAGFEAPEAQAAAEEPAAQPEKVVKNVARLPFTEQPEEPVSEQDAEAARREELTKAVYVARFGDEDAMTKMLTRDLYGESYMTKRKDQQEAFVKYVRFGENKLSSNEEALLHEIIMTPEHIRAEVKMDSSLHEVKAVLNETQNDLGGYLVPEDYRVQLTKKIADSGVIRGRARVISTSRDSVEWPKLLGGDDRYTSAVRVTWVEENPTDENKALTNPTFGMVKIPVHTAMARVDLSQNQLEDTAFNMIGIITELFGEAAGIDEDIQFATGVGGDAPRGVLGNRDGTAASPLAGVEAVSSGSAAALTPNGIVDLVYSLPRQYRANAIMLGARLTHRDIRKFQDTTEQYLWQPAYRAGEPPTLLGVPFEESESMPAIGANNYPLIYGDWRGYVIVDRIGMSVRRMEDTVTMGRNKVALFMKRRLGGDLIEPWRFKVQKVSA